MGSEKTASKVAYFTRFACAPRFSAVGRRDANRGFQALARSRCRRGRLQWLDEIPRLAKVKNESCARGGNRFWCSQLGNKPDKNVKEGTELYTDALHSYAKLADKYVHQVIDHAESYANGKVHTNGLENFWSLLKRGIKGTYVSVEPFHLFRYVDEQAFRFNERKTTDGSRFVETLSGATGRRLTYKRLTGKDIPETLQ